MASSDWPQVHRKVLGLRVSLVAPSAKWKSWTPCSKVIPNFQVVTTEHQMPCECTACQQSRLCLGSCGTHSVTLGKSCYLSGLQFPPL